MTTVRISYLGTGILILILTFIIVASLSDLHCTLLRPGDATFVLACRASRLEAAR